MVIGILLLITDGIFLVILASRVFVYWPGELVPDRIITNIFRWLMFTAGILLLVFGGVSGFDIITV